MPFNIRSIFSLSRWLLELRSPRYKISKELISCVHGFRCLFKNKKVDGPRLLVWDIRANSVTFDFLLVMLQVYIEYLQEHGDKIDVIIYLPHKKRIASFKIINGQKVVTDDDLYSRVHKIIQPIAKAFPFVCNVDITSDERVLSNYMRDASSIIPRNYHPIFYFPIIENYPRLFRELKSKTCLSVPYLNMVGTVRNELDIFRGEVRGPYVTFTLRDYGWSPQRNTNAQDVREFIKFSRLYQLKPVIIPDEIKNLPSYDISGDAIIVEEARIDISIRHLIYKNSVLNLFTNGGPALLSLLTRGTKTIIYNFGVDSIDASSKYLRDNLGLEVYDQPYRKLTGYIMWKQQYSELTASAIQSSISILESWGQGVEKVETLKEI